MLAAGVALVALALPTDDWWFAAARFVIVAVALGYGLRRLWTLNAL